MSNIVKLKYCCYYALNINFQMHAKKLECIYLNGDEWKQEIITLAFCQKSHNFSNLLWDFFLNFTIIPRINIMGYNCAHNRVGLFIFCQLHIAILSSRKGSDRWLKPGFKDKNVQTDYSIVLVQNQLANFCSLNNQYSWVRSSGWT